MNKESVGIIGMGRFGQVMENLLQNDFNIYVYDKDPQKKSLQNFSSFAEIIKCDTLFLCMPISQIEPTLMEIIKENCQAKTIIDTCSVKVYPVEIMKKHLPTTITAIATHPMFGPDSIKSQYPKNMMMNFVHGNEKIFAKWEKYFHQINISIHLMSPEQHDKDAAYSQAITHLIGRLLAGMKLTPSSIGTLGYNNLLQLMEQTGHDSPTLFADMIHYNPYCKEMMNDFLAISQQLLNKLNPPN